MSPLTPTPTNARARRRLRSPLSSRSCKSLFQAFNGCVWRGSSPCRGDIQLQMRDRRRRKMRPKAPRSLWKFIAAAERIAWIASPASPFERLRLNRCSFFRCPMRGSGSVQSFSHFRSSVLFRKVVGLELFCSWSPRGPEAKRSGEATLDRTRRRGRFDHAVATAASKFRPHVANHLPPHGQGPVRGDPGLKLSGMYSSCSVTSWPNWRNWPPQSGQQLL